MPDPQPVNTKPLLALIMMISAVSLAVGAGLIYSGIVPLPEDTRGIATLVVAVAAAADFAVGLWFFRMGQSS
jgi:hypothetical protein